VEDKRIGDHVNEILDNDERETHLRWLKGAIATLPEVIQQTLLARMSGVSQRKCQSLFGTASHTTITNRCNKAVEMLKLKAKRGVTSGT
jgi:hypothetical protein